MHTDIRSAHIFVYVGRNSYKHVSHSNLRCVLISGCSNREVSLYMYMYMYVVTVLYGI